MAEWSIFLLTSKLMNVQHTSIIMKNFTACFYFFFKKKKKKFHITCELQFINWFHTYRKSAGFVYLRFDTVEAASGAQRAMHMRWFARRLISAVFMVIFWFMSSTFPAFGLENVIYNKIRCSVYFLFLFFVNTFLIIFAKILRTRWHFCTEGLINAS